jgi:hypothetical protein
VLLRHGVALDAITPTLECTALWMAAYRGYLTIVEMLVSGGADIDIADNEGTTPLEAARDLGHISVVKYLDAETRWRKIKAWAMVRSSVREEEALSPMLKVLLCDDVAREIATYL